MGAVRNVVQGGAVGVHHGTLLIAGGVDGGSQIPGLAPLAIGILAYRPNIESPIAPRSVAGEVEGALVGRETGMGLVVIRVDGRGQEFRSLPNAVDEATHREVSGDLSVALVEKELTAVGR